MEKGKEITAQEGSVQEQFVKYDTYFTEAIANEIESKIFEVISHYNLSYRVASNILDYCKGNLDTKFFIKI